MAKAVLRPARASEIDVLSDLCRRSKAHWGYDATFMQSCHEALAISADAIAAGLVWVAVEDGDVPVGVVQLVPAGDLIVDLDKLFVEPTRINRGLGGVLFARAVMLARQGGFRLMTILADPHAADFYERMGARFHRMAPSDSIAERELPLYVYDL